jgi:hypothetical protein
MTLRRQIFAALCDRLRSRDIYGLHFNRHYENKLSGKALLQIASTGSATGAAAELGSLGILGEITDSA